MNRKRIYLVNRDFQLKYTGAAVGVGILSTIFTSFILLFPLYQFEILKIALFVPGRVLLFMTFAAFINVVFVAILGIIITQKIAGPMYSLVRHFRRIEEGHWYGHMHLREGDELRYLMRNFNAMLSGLIRTGQRDLEHVLSIKDALQDSSNLEEQNKAALGLANALSKRIEDRLSPAPAQASED